MSTTATRNSGKKKTAKKSKPSKKKLLKRATSKKRVAKKKPTAKKKSVAKKKAAPKKKAAAKKTAAKKTPSPKVSPAPKVGAAAPNFSLQADDGRTVELADLKGKNVVLYFYPRDSTPGCTIEACGFRDAMRKIQRAGAVVLGVSRDSQESHRKFRQKQKLNFRLLSDPEAEVIAAYGSWGKKKFMGREFMGILRTTVLIGRDGKVLKVYPKVSPKGHAEEVLADLRELG